MYYKQGFMLMTLMKAFFILISSLFITSCATKYTPPETDSSYKEKTLRDIKSDFDIERMNNIKIVGNEAKTSKYVAAIDDDDIIYIGTKKLNDSDEIAYIWFDHNGFDVEFNTKAQYRCGYSLLFKQKGNNTHEGCLSEFSSIKNLGAELTGRIYMTIGTAGIATLFAGNSHLRAFDDEYFRLVVIDTNLDKLQHPIVNKIQYNPLLKTAYEVIEIDEYNFDNSIENPSLRTEYDGAIFVDDKNGQIYGIYNYDDYRSSNYSIAINRIISDLYKNIARSKNITITKEMIEEKIPPQIKKPSIPPPSKLVKSEYEKESEFKQRVKKAADAREKKIRAMQEEYDREVEARNEYITKLEHMYQKQLNEQRERREKLIDSIDANMESLSKFLFTRYMNGFKVTNANYDAESETLYFTLISNSDTYKNMVKASLPPSDAARIKERRLYTIKPDLEYGDDTLYVSGFEIESDGSEYDIVYTNRSFEPTQMVVTVAEKNENIEPNRQLDFSAYKQAQVDLIDYSKKEQWFVDVVARDSAKVPEWFKDIQLQDGLYGYGVGNSLDEATEVAIASLARHLEASINATSTIKREATNSNQLHSDYKREIDVRSDIILSKDDYRLYKQDMVDNKWYVVLEYKKEM